jgi:hypothetical protein
MNRVFWSIGDKFLQGMSDLLSRGQYAGKVLPMSLD